MAKKSDLDFDQVWAEVTESIDLDSDLADEHEKSYEEEEEELRRRLEQITREKQRRAAQAKKRSSVGQRCSLRSSRDKSEGSYEDSDTEKPRVSSANSCRKEGARASGSSRNVPRKSGRRTSTEDGARDKRATAHRRDPDRREYDDCEDDEEIRRLEEENERLRAKLEEPSESSVALDLERLRKMQEEQSRELKSREESLLARRKGMSTSLLACK